MTDSKTAKKIEVVPCPFFHIDDGRFSLLIDGVHTSEWCGTEAEAQAKAQQIANEEANKRQDELNAHFALTPTETRPPQHPVYIQPTLCGNCENCGEPVYDNGTVAVHRKLILMGGQLTHFFSQWCVDENTLPRTSPMAKPARAAAPVERCVNTPETCQQASCRLSKKCELVEPAPRPQFECTICPDRNPHEHLTDGTPAFAASSPVARPQPKGNTMCEINPRQSAFFRLEAFTAQEMSAEEFTKQVSEKLLASEMELNKDTRFRFHIHEAAEPAARVEQPTPPETILPCGHKPSEYPPASAAPVVEQRDFALIAAEKIFALFKNVYVQRGQRSSFSGQCGRIASVPNC